jgi:hypothetical protein
MRRYRGTQEDQLNSIFQKLKRDLSTTEGDQLEVE